ncbi:MAG: IucA/IucC family protein [Candidatus Diapherotrites archaeon]
MQLEEFQKDPLGAMMYAERFVNQRNYSEFCNQSEVLPRYWPQNVEQPFSLPHLSSSPDGTHTNGRHLLVNHLKKNPFFFVHPDSGYPFETQSGKFAAIPTASMRTLLLQGWHSKPIFVKTSLPKRISRFTRELDESALLHSLRVSNKIERFCRKRKEFALLRDFGGTSFQKVGCLYRDTLAGPKQLQHSHLIPAFSLYSRDKKRPQEDTLLSQLAKANGTSEKRLAQWILETTTEYWCEAAIQTGCLLEFHGQNTLVETDAEFRPQRIVARDFSSVRIDGAFVFEPETPIQTRKVIGKGSNFGLEQEYSLSFDFFMCHHFFQPLIEHACNGDASGRAELENCVKSTFESYFKNSNKFPTQAYGYANKAFGSEKPELEVVWKSSPFR